MTQRRSIRYLVASLLSLTIVLGVWIYLGFRDDLNAAIARTSIGNLVQTPCGPIEYASVGKGAPVLMVHGAGGGFDQGLDVGGQLANFGYRVIAMSRFGYLRKPLPTNASAEAQADAFVCLLDALNVPRAAIIGVSAGGPSALQFALRHAERCSALVLMVPAGYVPRVGESSVKTPSGTTFLFDAALRSDFLFWLGPKLARKTFMRAILATPPDVVEMASAEDRARAMTTIEHTLPVSTRRLGLLNDSAIVSSLPRYELERITAPTLTLSVADDLYGTYDVARYTAEHIPNARFVGYRTGGHVLLGHQSEAIDEIARFLQ